MTNKIFIGRDGDLEQITEDEIKNQRPYRKFVDYIESRIREAEFEADDRMMEKFKKEEQLKEEEMDEEFEEITSEEEEDLDEIFDIIRRIGDQVAEVVIEKYFEYKEKKERRERNEY